MPLNFDLRKVAPEAKADGEPWELTNTLIWATMAVDMGCITAKTLDEFCRRLDLWQFNINPFVWEGEGKPYYITREDVALRVGLSTNVTTTTTKQWDTRFKQILFEGAGQRVKANRPE